MSKEKSIKYDSYTCELSSYNPECINRYGSGTSKKTILVNTDICFENVIAVINNYLFVEPMIYKIYHGPFSNDLSTFSLKTKMTLKRSIIKKFMKCKTEEEVYKILNYAILSVNTDIRKHRLKVGDLNLKVTMER